jgi:hypothetical protein
MGLLVLLWVLVLRMFLFVIFVMKIVTFTFVLALAFTFALTILALTLQILLLTSSPLLLLLPQYPQNPPKIPFEHPPNHTDRNLLIPIDSNLPIRKNPYKKLKIIFKIHHISYKLHRKF